MNGGSDLITVSVKFLLHLESSADLSSGKKVIDAEIREGSTFGQFLQDFADHFSPALADEIYDSEKQALQEMVLCIINGVLIHNFDGLETVLHNGDTIIFVPSVVGG